MSIEHSEDETPSQPPITICPQALGIGDYQAQESQLSQIKAAAKQMDMLLDR
jgi:hypothetical protein